MASFKNLISNTSAQISSGGTITGDLVINGDLQVDGGGSLSFDEIIEGTSTIDVNSTTALVVRKDGAGGDVFTVNTTNSRVNVGTPTGTGIFEVEGSVDNDYAGRFENKHSGGYGALVKIAGTTANDLVFQARASSNNILTILGNSTVGINTASPSTSHALTVVGDVQLTDQHPAINFTDSDDNSDSRIYHSAGSLYIDADNNNEVGSSIIRFSVDDSEVMRMVGSSVGIGAGTDTAKPLHIKSSDNQPVRVESTDAYSGIELKDNGSSTLPPLISALSDDFIFYGGHGSSRPTILTLTSSSQLATFAGDVTISGGDMTLTGSTTSIIGEQSAGANRGKIKFVTSGSDGDIVFETTTNGAGAITEAMRIAHDGSSTFAGDVNISKAGNATLNIKNSSDGLSDEGEIGAIEFEGNDGSTNRAGVMSKIVARYSDTGSGDAIDGSANEGGSLGFFTSIATSVGGSQTLAEKMRIENNGNVGIGTNSPAQMLHIASSTDAFIQLERVDTSVADGDAIGAILFRGGESSIADIGRIRLHADADFTSSSSPTKMVFETTPSGTTVDAVALTLSSDQSATFANKINAGSWVQVNDNNTLWSDPSTGVFIQSPSTTQTINFRNNSSQVGMVYDASAFKMGIGGSHTPTSHLHLENASSPTIRIKDTTNNVILLAFAQDSDAGFGTYSGHPMKFYSNSTLALTLGTDQSATFSQSVDGDAYIALDNVAGAGSSVNETAGLRLNLGDGSTIRGGAKITAKKEADFSTGANMDASLTLSVLQNNAYNDSLIISSAGNVTVNTGALNIKTAGQELQWVNGATKITGADSYLEFNVNSARRLKLDADARISLSNNDSGGTGGADSTSANTVFGYLAGTIDSGSVRNTFIGHKSGFGTLSDALDNTCVGHGTGIELSQGDNNVLVGSYAGYNINTGSDNVNIGKSAGNAFNSSNTIAIGSLALGSINNADADGSVAVGHNALTALTSGIANTAVGFQALDGITSSSNNTALGYNALTACGDSYSNVAIGKDAGDTITNSGGLNTVIGTSADVSTGAAENQIVLGNGTTGVANNSVTLGNASVTDVYMASDSGATVHCANINLGGVSSGGANNLDDYEEGSWTPVITDGSNNATMSGTYNAGLYTKVGRVVHLTANIVTTSLGSVSGDIKISGLPFTAKNAFGALNGTGIATSSGLAITAGHSVSAQIAINTTTAGLNVSDATTGTTAMQHSEWTDDGNINFSMTYFV